MKASPKKKKKFCLRQATINKKKLKNLSLLNKFIYILNLLAEFALLLSYLASFISPAKMWYLAFFGLAYPVILLVNILFVIYWAVQLKWQFIISLTTILIGYKFVLSLYSFGNAEQNADEKGIKVLSYNVRNFDLYNWSHNIETRDKIIDLLKEEKPQILCVQEFYHDEKGDFPTVNSLSKITGIKDFYVHDYETARNSSNWGIALFSAYPVVNKGVIEFEESSGNLCIYADLKINKDTVRVYNAHLQSIKFKPEDYKTIEEIENYNNSNSEKPTVRSGKKILSRLKIAFQKRAKQVDLIAEHIKNCPYEVIVCGDFNDTPASYTYHNISKGLEDAFKESGSGFGNTYIGKMPSFRIDYILYSPGITSGGFRILPEKLSDHHAVSCFIELNR